MNSYYVAQKHALLELLAQVKNESSIRLLKSKQCILDFEPVLEMLYKTAHQEDTTAFYKELLDVPCGEPTLAIYTRLKWDVLLERLVVEKSIYTEKLDEEEGGGIYEREYPISRDFIRDMSERQLHAIYPMCEILIKKVIRSIESSITYSQKQHPGLWV